MSGCEEHAIRYPSRACRNRAKPYARIHIGIIRLIGSKDFAVALERWKRATGANDGATLGPAIKFCRRCLTPLSGIR
jgi:hypothetical protein